MDEEKEAREEGCGKGNRSIALFEGGEVQGKKKEPVEDETGTEVDKEVDQMVAEDLEATKVIVQAKGKIGKDSQGILVVGLDELVDPLEGEGLKMGARVKDDIGIIIEVERDMEGVGISHQGNHSHKTDSKKMLGRK